MNPTAVLDEHQTQRLALAMYNVFQTVCVPTMGIDSVYGIALPTDATFGATEAAAMIRTSFVVSDPYERFNAPAFPRLPLTDDIEIVLLAIDGPVHEVVNRLTLPSTAIGLVVASKARFAGVQSDPALPILEDEGYLVTACSFDHTYALAGIPQRDVLGAVNPEHPDVKSIRSVVNKSCCRLS